MSVEVTTPETVAEWLRCGPEQVIEELRTGNLPGVKFGKSWIVPVSALWQRVNEMALTQAAKRRQERGMLATAQMPAPAEKRGRGRPRKRPQASAVIDGVHNAQ